MDCDKFCVFYISASKTENAKRSGVRAVILHRRPTKILQGKVSLKIHDMIIFQRQSLGTRVKRKKGSSPPCLLQEFIEYNCKFLKNQDTFSNTRTKVINYPLII